MTSFGPSARLSFDILTKYNDRGVDKAEKDFKRLGRTSDSVRSKSSEFGRVAGAALLGVGTAAAAGLGKAIFAAKDFDKSIRMVGVQTKTSGKSLESLRQLALKMGEDTVFSAKDASAAMVELAKGGISAAQIKGGALAGTMKLAAAGELDMASAATYLGNSLASFGLKAKDADDVVTALAGGANASSASVQSLGLALAQVGPGAKLAGLSIQETVAALSAFDAMGVKGSDAGTSLKTMLMRLIPQTAKASGAMDDLGLSFTTAQGEILPLREVAERLQKSLKGVSAEQKTSALTAIFGSDAYRAAALMAELGAEGIDKYTRAAKDSAAAQKLANVGMRGASGAWENFTGSLETLSIKIGTKLLPAFTSFVNFLNKDGINAFSSMIDVISKAVRTFRDLPGAVKGAAVALGGFLLLRGKFAGFGTAISTRLITPFRDAGTAAGGFKTIIGNTAKSLLKGGLWGLAIGAAGGALSWLFGHLIEAKQRVDNLTEALRRDAGAFGKFTQAAIKQDIIQSGLIETTRKAGVSLTLATQAALGQAGAIHALNRRHADLNAKIMDLRLRFRELTPQQQQHMANLVAQKNALDEVIKKTGGLNGAFKESREAYRKEKAANDAAAKAVRSATDALSRQTDKGKENRKELAGIAKAAMNTAKRMLGLGKDQGSVTKKMEEARRKFIDVAKSMGVPEDRAKKLAENLINLKPKLKGAGDNFKTFRDRVNNFLGGIKDRQVNITTRAQIPAGVSVRQLMERGFASGGFVSGPGGPRDDKIPARLSDGEFVINAAATKRHRQVLEAINSGRGFANGGLVSVRTKSEGLGEFGAFTRQFNSGVGWMSQLIGKGLLEVLKSAGGPALRWAKSQAGKPYVWGGVGPGGYDCSGFMSAIVNVIRGRNPHSRLGSTATFPWSGFRPGRGNFMIGSTPNAGNGIGHMAGTLNGVNVESRGGDGVVIGGSARGATSSLFNGPYALQGYARGGLVKGDPPFDLMSPRGKHFQKMFAIFDKGGVLKPGQGGVNKSGKPERILSPRQTNAFERLVDNLLGGVKQSDAPLAKQLKMLHKTITGIAQILRKADRDRIANRLGDPFRKRIANLLRRRENLDERLEKAREKRDRIVNRRREVSGGLRGGILEGRNLVGGFGIDIDGGFSAGDLLGGLQQNLAKAKKFQGLLRSLRKKGFSGGIIAQIAAAGPEEGFSAAEALAGAQSGQVGQINRTFGAIGKTAGQFSQEMGRKLFGAGQKAAQGLVDGLRSKLASVQKIMARIARMMVRSLRKALDMRSPSRVMQKLGQLAGDGYTGGLAASMAKAPGVMDGAARDARRTRVRPVPRGHGGTVINNYEFNIPNYVGSRDELVAALRHALKTNRTLRRELGLAK